MKKVSVVVIAVGVLVVLSQRAVQVGSAGVDFDREVHPILAARCFACHGGDKRSGGLSLSTYEDVLQGGRSGAAIEPNDSKHSLFMLRVTGENQPRMPIGGAALTAQEMATLRNWIDEGARRSPDAAPAKGKWKPSLSLAAPEVPAMVW